MKSWNAEKLKRLESWKLKYWKVENVEKLKVEMLKSWKVESWNVENVEKLKNETIEKLKINRGLGFGRRFWLRFAFGRWCGFEVGFGHGARFEFWDHLELALDVDLN